MIKIELRNIKHAEFASEETNCYSASLYVDGVRIGEVSNEGRGGADRFLPAKGHAYAAYIDADKRVAAEYPADDTSDITGIPGSTMPASLEGLCAKLLGEWLESKAILSHLRSMTKTKVALHIPGRHGVCSVPLSRPLAILQPLLEAKYPGVVILNGMEPAAQVAAYKLAFDGAKANA